MTITRPACLCLLLLGALPLSASDRVQSPSPKVLKLESAGKDYLPLLSGPPDTVTMRSGLVVLAPGKSVGKHSTKGNEEVLVVLEGSGEMLLAKGETLPVVAGTVVYCPPQREHDVLNTGTGSLRYVYVVAKAKKHEQLRRHSATGSFHASENESDGLLSKDRIPIVSAGDANP